jgi:hypothetical protein
VDEIYTALENLNVSPLFHDLRAAILQGRIVFAAGVAVAHA